jgi:hypothetical protein
VEFGGAHGVAGHEVKRALAVLVAGLRERAVLQQQLGVLRLLEQAGIVQRCVAVRSLQQCLRPLTVDSAHSTRNRTDAQLLRPT